MGVNADSSELITAKASPADIVWENALFCNGDRSYDRLLKDLLEAEDLTPADYADGKYTHNFLTLIRTRGLTSQEDKVKGIADKAYACSLIDDHPHQLLYCADKCAYDCDSVPPFMRSKSEVHTTTKDDDGMPTFQTTLAEGVRQCGNIGSRMAQHEALLEAKSAFWTSMVLCQIAAHRHARYGQRYDQLWHLLCLLLLRMHALRAVGQSHPCNSPSPIHTLASRSPLGGHDIYVRRSS